LIALASLLLSILPAHTFHCIGFKSPLLRTTPTHRSSTEHRVSNVMSSGKLTFGSSARGRIQLGAGG
jgi:hypothetical protein